MPRFYFPLGLAMLFAGPLLSVPVPVHAQAFGAGSDAAQLASPGVARNQPGVSSGELTLPAAIALALERNSGLATARAEVNAVAATIVQAGARPNPEVSVLMEDTRKSSRSTTWQLNQTIEIGGKRGTRIDAARRAHDIARLALSARQADVRAGVTGAWFDTLIAQEKLRLTQDLLQLSKRSTDITSRRVTAGKVSPVEQTRARVADASAGLAVAQADSELMLARKRLAMYWGDADSTRTLAAGNVDTLPPLPALADLVHRVEDGPAIRLAQLEVDRRRALAKIESAKRLPDPTVSFGQKRDEEAGRNMWVVGVSMPIPLFDSNRGNRLESLKRVDQARDEQTGTQLRIRHEAAQSHERRRLAGLEIDVLRRDILPGARSAYDAASRGFELGKFSFLEVLDAQRTLFQAQSQYWQALSGAHQAAAELDRLAGSDLADNE